MGVAVASTKIMSSTLNNITVYSINLSNYSSVVYRIGYLKDFDNFFEILFIGYQFDDISNAEQAMIILAAHINRA